MTNSDVKNMKVEYKKALTEKIQEGVVIMASIVEVLDENPELEEATVGILQKYIGLFKPIVVEATEMAIAARLDAFKEFKCIGLSDELAVKMTLGR